MKLVAVFLMSFSMAIAGRNPSLVSVLSSGRRIIDGMSGSFDPSGFHMEFSPDGEPLLLKEGSFPREPVPCHEGQDDEGDWYALGSGVNDEVYAIAVNGSDVYVGGRFTQAGGNPANGIARWDGSSWHALGSGVSGGYIQPWVAAIAVSGSDVYVGGLFTQAGGNPANYIARWDGSSWHALGSGASTHVNALSVRTSDVYVGGWFTQAGGNPANYSARWDGSSWHELGSGLSDWVAAIAESGSDMHVGGVFTQAGGNPANYIARWDGSSWHALGSGVSNWVAAIAVSGSDVYAGGTFALAGDNPANCIARWDGSSWHALGSGVDDLVNAIAVSGSDVFVGGPFTQAGGNPASRIARWDGTSWHSLGSGVGYYAVFSIATNGSDVYVGGAFTQAGGNPVNYIARWAPDLTGIEPPVEGATPSLHASPNPMTTGTNLSFQSIGDSPLTLSIYDTAGRLLRTQDLGDLPVGSHTHYWDGRDGNGSTLASGVYFVRLSSPEQHAFTRVVLVR